MQTATIKSAPRRVAEHLTAAPGSEWAFWRCVCLRGTGFPADGVLKLSAPRELVEAADGAAAAKSAAEFARQKALQQINTTLDQLRADGRWHDKNMRTTLLKGGDKLRKNQVPNGLFPAAVQDSIEEVRASIEKRDIACNSFAEKFLQCSQQTSRIIREIASSSEFREAVSWQNPSAVRTALDQLSRKVSDGVSRSSRQRQHEELVATYLQRYCMKNDTIGFFGPVGWARFVDEGDSVEVRPGNKLIATRKTYWEAWPIEALAAVIAKSVNVRPWLAPILMPFIRVEGVVLHDPMFGSRKITAGHAAIIGACDGFHTAKQIAERVLHMPGRYFGGESEIYEALGELANRRIIFWAFKIPLCPYPEHVLRAALESIGDKDARQHALRLLDELDSAKKRVEMLAGSPEELSQAFVNLEQVFTGVTGRPATRNHGKAYGGRTLVYEDCRRDLEMRLGPELLRSLEAPLSLLLMSARWITCEIARAYKGKFKEIYFDLVRSTGSTLVDARMFWARALPLFFDEAAPLKDPVQAEFRRKWDTILELGPGQAPVTYSSSQLRQRVIAEFAGTRPGWTGARYHSPDIMIAASSDEAIRRGNYFFVIGEMHVSANTLGSSLFVNQHPHPEELLYAVEQDLGPANIVPVEPKNQDRGCRIHPALVCASNFRLEYATDSFALDRSKAIAVSTLVVENRNGELFARTRDGRFRTPLIDLVGNQLGTLVVDSFKMMPPRPHTPRVSIDRLVIRRESWQFSTAEVDFIWNPSPAERFLQARQWARTHGIPRFAFVKLPVEPKPSYVDFESPIMVDILSKMMRRMREENLRDSNVDITEMLPAPDQVWLVDGDHKRYTSELRMVAVDLGETDIASA